MELTEFLLARIAEDEAEAIRWQAKMIEWAQSSAGASVVVFAAGDPARVLADCEAKRRIVTLWEQTRRSAILAGMAGGDESIIEDGALRDGLRLLTLPYASHPHYDKAWRP